VHFFLFGSVSQLGVVGETDASIDTNEVAIIRIALEYSMALIFCVLQIATSFYERS
jgi:hypothetical protein